MKIIFLIIATGFVLTSVPGCFDNGHSHDDGSHSHDQNQQHKNSIN